MAAQDSLGGTANVTTSSINGCGCSGGSCGPRGGLDRRSFVQFLGGGVAAAAWTVGGPAIAGPFNSQDTIDHFVPADKKLAKEWIERLYARGEQTWYTGNDLKTIGMPVGGICAGQVYLTGDGRLVYWDIFNSNHDTGYGQINYKEGRRPTDVVAAGKFTPATDVAQGVALEVTSGGQAVTRTLDAKGFADVRFCGEYPFGTVTFQDKTVPVEVTLEAFSPFIPLDAADSALPATVLSYTVKNTGTAAAEVSLAAWLQNAVLSRSVEQFAGEAVRRNQVVKGSGITTLLESVKETPQQKQPARPPVIFADFESADYGKWKVEGKAFGRGPVKGTMPNQQKVAGFQGEKLVNSFGGGDDTQHGKLISPTFTVERPWIGFLIGGGEHAERTCMNFVVDGKVVRTAAGHNREELQPHSWHVKEFAGKEARLEIVDAESGGWGHVNVDQIEFRDEPMADAIPLRRRPDFGSMAISVVGDDYTFAIPAISNDGELAKALFAAASSNNDNAERRLEERLLGAVGKTVELKAGEQATITFVVAWSFPNNYFDNRWVGHYYAKRFTNASASAQYVADNWARLTQDTRTWHDTYYDSTLPHWLLDRIGATICNLATGTCYWRRNGRFWAWEGVGCCHGTCGHVWNYAHALARLFPELERSVRTMQDFVPGIGFDAATGAIGFRGEGWTLWAGDSQGGYILKAYREHLCSPNDDFLNENWKSIRKAVEFLFAQDGNDDGLIEGSQHQTYDEYYFGANTFVGSLYLGALRAADEMARQVGDDEFADRCRKVFEAGRENSVKRLYNGEYFRQTVDLKEHPNFQYADGCLADHMFGQGWARQVGLGDLYPKETVAAALQSIWKYNWAPDIANQNKHHDPERWFAMTGEAGLFTCTWPKTKHMGPQSTRYRDEVWTGSEYQVANHMAWEGMLTECLAICRAIHERYHPSKRNPYNEIECGDHYARSLASWGVIVALAGFSYDGPRGHIGFAPRLTPDNFKSVFTAAEGWGSYEQRLAEKKLTARLDVKWGRLPLNSLSVALPPNRKAVAAEARADGKILQSKWKQVGDAVTLSLSTSHTIDCGGSIEIEVRSA